MRAKLNEEDQKQILDSVNTLMKLRRKEHIQITLNNKDDNLCDVNNDKNSTTDSIIISKDYYEEHDSSDELTDESIKSKSDSENYYDNLERSQNCQLQQQNTSTIVEIDLNEHYVDGLQTSRNQLSDEDNENVINSKFNEFECKVAKNNNEIHFNTDFSETRSNSSTESKKLPKNNISISEIKYNDIYKELNLEKSEKDYNNMVFVHNDNIDGDDHSVLQNQEQNIDITNTNNVFSSTSNLTKCNNQDITVKQSTTAILCAKGLRSLEIIPDTDNNVLNVPTITALTEPDLNKIKEMSISLPWKQPYLGEEEYHIKKMSK